MNIVHDSVTSLGLPLSFGNPYYNLLGKLLYRCRPEEFSCLAIFHKSQSGIALFSEHTVPKCPPLPLSCMFVKRAKSRPELGPLRTGTSGIPRLAHHGPIFFLRPPACTLLHSHANVKPPPTPTGLEDKYFPGKRHKRRGLGHCKLGHLPSRIKRKYQER